MYQVRIQNYQRSYLVTFADVCRVVPGSELAARGAGSGISDGALWPYGAVTAVGSERLVSAPL